MPRQWKLIALYMLIVYAVLVGVIHYAKHAAENEPIVPPSQTEKSD